MKSLNENIEVLNPKNQLNLFGYKRHFNSIAKLFDKKKCQTVYYLVVKKV